ncbi:hypothetical protein [Caenispirillum salinarum]|uniref:hypothetical protein n=1 Tax=Caenispirillum salinarum TaxID=859058 RepID=UPI00384EA32B
MSGMVIQTKTNFSAGELSPRLYGRGDLRAYENGASRLRNVVIHPTGGVSRRPGLRWVDGIEGKARLLAFEFNTEQVYLLVFTHLKMAVYKDDARIAVLDTPWTEVMLPNLNWTQSADTLLVVHPDCEPQTITRTSHTRWVIAPWYWYDVQNRRYQPHHKFATTFSRITPSGTSGSVTLTVDEDVFVAEHVGARLRIDGKEVEITAVTDARTATATCHETLASTDSTKDWTEMAFSAARGWPVSVTFHQDRLVIGGSRDLPNRVWMSKTSAYFTFDPGSGLDDESVDFAILSDQVNAIRTVFSGRTLQVFTTGAEWTVTGSPITPTSIAVHRQTRVGMPPTRAIPPRDVDGATLFIGAAGKELREFLFTDAEQAYQAADLAMLARHLMVDPSDMDYDATRRLIHLVMSDGSLATVTNYRAEQVTGWTRNETDGAFHAVAVVGETVYTCVERAGAWSVEAFDDAHAMDAALSGTAAAPKTHWSGLDHLEGRTVKILGDGAELPPASVSGGAVDLPYAVSEIRVGLPFTHEIAPLPPVSVGQGGVRQSRALRLIRASFRVLDTQALAVDTGRGPAPAPLKRLGPSGVLDSPPPAMSGDVSVRAVGWRRQALEPVWRVVQDTPLPCTILSVATEMKVTD